MYHVTEAMTRWIAPILSFTADEVWENMPGERDDMGVFVAEWYDGLTDYADTEIDAAVWDAVEQVRDEVKRTLELLRKDGRIGSSLDAEIIVQAEPALLEQLQAVGDELRFVMITSAASLAALDDPGAEDVVALRNGHRVRVLAEPSAHAKCARCWHHRADVGSHDQHPELCGRCVDNVDGDGEKRRFA